MKYLLTKSNLTECFVALKNLKVKYVWAFTTVIMLYFFLFEQRYFEIRSHWKLACDTHSFKDCYYKTVEDDSYNILAVYSNVTNEILVVDVLHQPLLNVLPEPKIFKSFSNLGNIMCFDVHMNDATVQMYVISDTGFISYFLNDKLIYNINLFNKVSYLTKKHEFIDMKYIPKDEMLLVFSYKELHMYITALNSTNCDLIWSFNAVNNSASSTKQMKKSDDNFNENSVWNHWKLKLMQHHEQLEHLREKSRDIDIKQLMPFSSSGKLMSYLFRAEKYLTETSPKKQLKSKSKESSSFNSLFVLHNAGVDLVDLVSGVNLASMKFKWDNHSTYSMWPSIEDESVLVPVQIRFTSKLTTDENNNIDYMHKHENKEHAEQHMNRLQCFLVFSKLYPDAEKSSNFGAESFLVETKSWSASDLCHPVSIWDYPRFTDPTWLEDDEKSIVPIITFNEVKPMGVWGRLYHLISKRIGLNLRRNVICMSSDGLLTSYSAHNHVNWRANAQVGWLHISRMAKGNHFDDTVSVQSYRQHFKPSLTAMKLQFYNKTIHALLAVGFESFSLVDESDGHLLVTHSLPCTPSDTPMVFSRAYSSYWQLHGDTIVVVKCENMLLGFSINHELPWLYFVSVAGVIFMTIVFLAWCLDPNNPYLGQMWTSGVNHSYR